MAFAVQYFATQTVAESVTTPPALPHFAGAVLDPATRKMCEIGALLNGSEGASWTYTSATKIGRLVQEIGSHMPIGTNTIIFIPHNQKPANKKVTYIRIVATNRPNKTKTKRVR